MFQRRLSRLILPLLLLLLFASCSNKETQDPLEVIPNTSSLIMSLDMKTISYQLAWEAFTNWDQMNEMKELSSLQNTQRPEDLGLDMLNYYYLFINESVANKELYGAMMLPISDHEKFHNYLMELEGEIENYSVGPYDVYENQERAFLIHQDWVLCLIDMKEAHASFKAELEHLLELPKSERVSETSKIKDRIYKNEKQAVVWLDVQKASITALADKKDKLKKEITDNLVLVAGVRFEEGLLSLDIDMLVEGNKILSKVQELGNVKSDMSKYIDPEASSYTAIHFNEEFWKSEIEKIAKKYEKVLSGKGVSVEQVLGAMGEDYLFVVDDVYWETNKVYDYISQQKIDKTELAYDLSLIMSINEPSVITAALDKLGFLMIFKERGHYNFFGGMAYIKVLEDVMKISTNAKYIHEESKGISNLNLGLYNFYHYSDINKISQTLNSRPDYKWSESFNSLEATVQDVEVRGLEISNNEINANMKINFNDKDQSSLFQFMKIMFGFLQSAQK